MFALAEMDDLILQRQKLAKAMYEAGLKAGEASVRDHPPMTESSLQAVKEESENQVCATRFVDWSILED